MSEYVWPMIYEFAVGIFIGSITYKVGKRYQQKKNEVIRTIFLFTAFMALAPVAVWFSNTML